MFFFTVRVISVCKLEGALSPRNVITGNDVPLLFVYGNKLET